MINISYLYITDNGSIFKVDGGYFIVQNKKGDIRKIPKETLESVALFGNISVTTPCVKELLERNIPVSYFSSKGAYFGRLESTSNKNILRLKKQIYLSENRDFSLGICRKIISAKINNQIVILRRYSKNRLDLTNEINYMKISKNKVPSAVSREELMGYEGTAARCYFGALSKLIKPEFAFKGRNRMPPKDPFNSMISLGYTILMYEIYGYIENKGLSPYCGYLHSDKERHPTLASDLMEEWRAIIIDSTVLSLIEGNEITIDHFIKNEETGGIFLDSKAMHKFLNKYENKMRQITTYIDNSPTSYRKCLWKQVDSLVKTIELNDCSMYVPIMIR